MAPANPTQPSEPLVSIVTPTLQRAELLELTLRSLRAQTYQNVEHIVIDGGSTDGTLELLRRYEREHGIRWQSEPDSGMYDAINKGLRMARGEIIAYVNSDDLYFPWSVERAVDTFNKHPEADFVFGDVIRVDEIRGITVPIFVPPYRVGAMAAYGTLSQPAVFLRRRVIDELRGFDVALRYVADLEFWLRAGSRFRFERVDEFLALEQRHEAMLSEASREKMTSEDVRVRNAFRRGFGGTQLGRFAAYVWWHWWSGRRWLAFCLSSGGRRAGWERTILALRPQIDPITAAVGWFPSKGSRLRARVRWEHKPLAVASDDTSV